jgi:putative transposase
MPRRARLMLAGMPVHITHRGNNRQECFYQDSDRAFYLFHLRRLLPRAQCSLHAYCLMSNHVHLLLTPAAIDSCARLMKGVAQLHTQYVNRTYGRSGSLWEGRFHSCVVQSQDYLLNCYRYVERNPVDARVCAHPGEYEWSSYHTNAGGIFDAAITQHAEYLALGGTVDSRRAAYCELLAVPLDPKTVDEIRDATNGNFALGNEKFKRLVSIALGRRAYRAAPGRPSQRTTSDKDQADLFGGS